MLMTAFNTKEINSFLQTHLSIVPELAHRFNIIKIFNYIIFLPNPYFAGSQRSVNGYNYYSMIHLCIVMG